MKVAITWETIGPSRFSLYYAARENTKQADQPAYEALKQVRTFEDVNVVVKGRFFHGRVLLLDGQQDVAMQQFNSHNESTPSLALCIKPSDEHRQYLRELIGAGADMSLLDVPVSRRARQTI